MEIRQLIDSSRMGVFQWVIILITLFINALDGFDAVAIAFVAQPLTQEFGLSPSLFGWILSSALVGVGIGSLLIAPLADKYGRRTLIVVGLVFDLIGLVLTALAGSVALIFIARIITGIGVGIILACLTVLVSEFSNVAKRGLAVSIFACGYGLGAAACGAIAKSWGITHGWQAVFWIGSALTVIAIALTVFVVPESPDFLLTKGKEDKVRSIARRLGLTLSDAPLQPAPERADAKKFSLADILSAQWRVTTLKLWGAFILVTFAFTFATQWTPKLLATAGLSTEQGIIGGIMLSFGGTIGSVIYGILTTKVSPRNLLIGCAIISSFILVGFINSTGSPSLMFALGVCVGMFLNGCITGLYTVTPASYPAHLRTTGIGSAIGVARVGAITAPIIAGYLLEAGWTPVALYTGAAVATVLAAIILIGVKSHSDS